MRSTRFLRHAALLAGISGAVVLAGCGGGGDTAASGGGAATSATAAAVSARALPASLSAEEIAGLRYMREEEKLAHDVYAAFSARWGLGIFASIADSESRHTEAIRQLLVNYALEDPAAGKAPGVFEDATLQALYDKLLATGSASATAALGVGALIEETDVRDIGAKKAITEHADILHVYDNLLCGSGNHLRAFNTQLLASGITYVPQVISQQEWDAIASATPVACGG